MATLTIRNVPPKIVKTLKNLARRNRRSMEQEVRAVLEEHAGDRESLLAQVESAWAKQARRPSAAEIEQWLKVGRE
jgi:plasmid stability protein